jgi:conjugative transfer signal peptidase TraF
MATTSSITRDSFSLIMWIGATAWALASVGKAAGLTINTSGSSAPPGFYYSANAPIRDGALVKVCLPHQWAKFGLKRRYIGAGMCPDGIEPVIKYVGARGGEKVHVAPGSIPTIDTAGRPMPHFIYGDYIVPAGSIWLVGTILHSFDSRFYGDVPKGNVVAVLRPIWTW